MEKFFVLDKKYFVMDNINLSWTNLILSSTKNILSRQMDRAYVFSQTLCYMKKVSLLSFFLVRHCYKSFDAVHLILLSILSSIKHCKVKTLFPFFSCRPQAAAALGTTLGLCSRILKIIAAFSTEQYHQYHQHCLGLAWLSINIA